MENADQNESFLPDPTAIVQHKGGFKATWFYRQLLNGPVPKKPRVNAPELWPGDPLRGHELLKGIFSFQSERYHLTSAANVPAQASANWLSWFHSLAWLSDLKALGGTDQGVEAPYFAREWALAWINAHTTWSYFAWDPTITAERVMHWILTWDFLTNNDASGLFSKSLRKVAGRDARHVLRSKPDSELGFQALRVLKGQIFAIHGILGGERRQQNIMVHLDQELGIQVLPDGGHIERNPEILALVLRDLLQLRSFCAVAMGQVPACLQNAIDRSAPMLRTLRHPDGALALFNGGQEGKAADLDLLLGQTDPTTSSPVSAPYAGFQRLNAGSTVILMDCGQPGGPGHNHHAGTLSFELSFGRKRLIVNCGARSGKNDPWRTALAATAAHSTLTVNDTSSAAFALDGTMRRGPVDVTCKRQDSEIGTLVETSHSGYVNTFGLTHHRALFMDATGEDIRGEDRLTGTGGEYASIRFHLHPDVQASLVGNNNGVLLRFDSKSKQVWRFKSSLGDVTLEESIYMGRVGEHRRCEQIVVSVPLSGNGALIQWSLQQSSV